MRRNALIFFLFGVLSWCTIGCSGGPHSVKIEYYAEHFEPIQQYPLVVVAPAKFRNKVPSYLIYQRLSTLVSSLAFDGMVPVMAPWEYEYQKETIDLLKHTNLFEFIRKNSISPKELLYLEVLVLEFSNKNETTVEGKSEIRYAAARESDYIIMFTLLHPLSRAEIGKVTVNYHFDPFVEEVQDWDPQPGFRIAMELGAHGIIEILQKVYPEVEGDLELPHVKFNPKEMFDFSNLPGDDSLAVKLSKMELIEQMAVEPLFYQYFKPDITMNEVNSYKKLPPGFWLVKANSEFENNGFQDGDYVLKINDVSVHGPHALLKFLFFPFSKQTSVTVLREGEQKVLSIRKDTLTSRVQK